MADVRKKVAPLYVARPVLNARAILDWARAQGLEPNVPADELHVTVTFSRSPVDWFGFGESWPHEIRVPEGGPRTIERFGDAIVLRFASSDLDWRHEQMVEGGASWDFESYKPHVTVRYDAPADLDLSGVEPYEGPIVLGPEMFDDLRTDDDIMETMKTELHGSFTKVDEAQRVAYGWFSVIEEGGKAVVDSQGDVIREKTLVKAVHEFLTDSRAGKVMHKGSRVADVVESVVFTRDVQQALGVDLGKVGWFGAMKFRDDATWDKVRKGELRAFSIGGTAGSKEIADAA